MALIYLVEDDANIREIEEYALINAGHEVCSFESANSFYKKIEEKIPDLCILDIMLPDESGNQILGNLRRDWKTKNLPIIMLTAKSSELDLIKGLEEGADDYIKKPFSVMELISRVKALLRRNNRQREAELKIAGLVINDIKHEVRIENKKLELTFKEYELLSMLVSKKGSVVPRDAIMDRIWGYNYEGESRTLDMHIKTLRRKLGDYGQMIKTVRNVGYLIDEKEN